jgi:hypothetical protein
MLQHAAEFSHRLERRGKRPAVVAFLVSPTFLDESRESTPARARRMRDHGIRTGVQTRVARHVPQVNVRDAGVCPALLRE